LDLSGVPLMRFHLILNNTIDWWCSFIKQLEMKIMRSSWKFAGTDFVVGIMWITVQHPTLSNIAELS
jgi:hypothetical protein